MPTKRLEKIYKLKKHPDNPRIIKDDKYKLLVKSIKEFPEMLEKRPLVVNKDMIVLGGNMRLAAAQEAGLKEIWIDETDWEEQKQKEFIIKDNSGFGAWDWDALANQWNEDDLKNWGLDIPKLNNDDIQDLSDDLQLQYKLEIQLDNESEQETLYNDLTKKGYQCRILTL